MHVGTSDIILNTTFTFGDPESDAMYTIMNASLTILNDFLSQKRRHYNISIENIDVLDGNASSDGDLGALTMTSGEAIELIIYDNDCEFDN